MEELQQCEGLTPWLTTAPLGDAYPTLSIRQVIHKMRLRENPGVNAVGSLGNPLREAGLRLRLNSSANPLHILYIQY